MIKIIDLRKMLASIEPTKKYKYAWNPKTERTEYVEMTELKRAWSEYWELHGGSTEKEREESYRQVMKNLEKRKVEC